MEWVVQVEAIDPFDGELKTWTSVMDIPSDTQAEAQEFLDENEFGYMTVLGRLVHRGDLLTYIPPIRLN